MSGFRNALSPTGDDLSNRLRLSPSTQADGSPDRNATAGWQQAYADWQARGHQTGSMADWLKDFDPSDPAQRAAMPDLGPATSYDPNASWLGWTDPNRNLGQQAQNALLGQAWQSNALPANSTQYYGDDDPVAQRARRNAEMRSNPGTYDAVINAGLARQTAAPSLPTYAPTGAWQIGADPRFDTLRQSDLIEDRRPTALLLRTGASQ